MPEPHACGISGDLFAIVWDAGEQRLHGRNASGPTDRPVGMPLHFQSFHLVGNGLAASSGRRVTPLR